ncbi:MAG: UDP-3-O-(3-hydroxymyristoyl)glucosamine N-acyltransferase [Nitrospirota bacterium]
MEKTLRELAELSGGELEGDGSINIKGVSGIREAGPGDITFLANPKYLKELHATKAAAVIAAPGVDVGGRAAIRAKNPYFVFAKILTAFSPAKKYPGVVMAGAQIEPGAEIADGVTVFPGAYIRGGARIAGNTVIYPGVFVGEGSVIGSGCILYPNVVVRDKVIIGDRVTIHGGSVIGGDGFGYATEDGRHYKIPQIGGVVIEDDVEIGSNVTIDRGALGDTVIKRGTKIDNLVMIAHNVVVGEDSILVAQVGISGSTELGHHVVLAGQVGLVGHLHIGDGVKVGAQSGVMNDLEPWEAYTGSPALPHREFLKIQAVMRRLPEMRKQLNEITKKLERLEKEKETEKEGE